MAHAHRNLRTEDARHVRMVTEEPGLAARMNDTKWRELCEFFRSWSSVPRFRISDVLARADHISEWDREWYYHPQPYAGIRWLEVELDTNEVARALAMCKSIGAAVEVVESGIRIWGWIGPTDHPQFA